MSYEKVLCGSPESDSTEEPPPSLYSVELEEPGLRLKKKQLAENQRPLAETVNIEDQIMNDDEIARVNSAAGESKSRRNFEESDGRRKFEKSAPGNKKNFGCETDDRRWIDLNLRNTGGTGIPSAFELDGRESVIKRRNKLASDSDESRKKDDSSSLQCDESMAEEISRPIYEGYGSGIESERGSSNERKPLPIYYYGPHMVGVGSASQGGLHPHVVRAADFRAELGRPEQQVPVAGSPSVEQRYGMHAPLQFMRAGFPPTNVAVVPNLGPVRVVDEGNGMYYAIPMGADPSQYENLAQSFIPVSNILSGDASQSTSSADLPQAQDKSFINTQKLYTSTLHRNTASPSSSSDDHKSNASPGLRSDHGSPAPAPVDDLENKGAAMQKGRAKPKPTGGRAEIKCDQCGKTFGSSSALAKHKLTHSDERRYVCTTCGKGFKRQDHLNGHMVTHRDKKPYECSYQDCDKSYCDMRSLRRHLENHHAAETGANSSGMQNINRKPVVAAVSSVEAASLPRNSYKPSRGKPPKEKGSSGDLLQGGECESGKSSGRSTPGSVHDVKPGDAGSQTCVPSRQHNSDSFSSAASDDVADIAGEPRAAEPKPHGPQEPSKPKSAADMLKQAAVRAQEHRIKQSSVGTWEQMHQQQPYVMYYPEGMQYQQWCPAAVYSQDPHVVYQYHPSMVPPQVYQFAGPSRVMSDAQNMRSQGMPGRAAAENELRNEMMKNSMVGPGVSGVASSTLPSAETMQASVIAQQQHQAVGGTPTDAMAIALATAKDMGQHKFNKESYYSVHPSGTQWQPVQYADLPSTYDNSSESVRTSVGNVKTVIGQGVAADDTRTAHSGGESETVISHSRGTQCRNGRADERFEPPQKRHCPMESVVQTTSHSHRDKNSDGVFRNPAEILPRRIKQRPRPEPLTIPASVSTAYHSNRPGSPHGHSRPASPPYTPPPMLSPRSIFSHVSMAGNLTPRSGGPPQLPMTPSRLFLSSRSCRSSIDHEGEEEPAPPEPKINIGPQFQAEVPPFTSPKEFAKHDLHRATLVWKQLDERKRSRREEIESFLDMACSVAVIGGSTNKEYALHILHKSNGNVKDAVKLLLNKKNVTGANSALSDYHYEGSCRWSAKERQTFRNSFRSRGKEFAEVQKDVGNTKSVADCVEFYYLWKATHPEAVRGRTRYIDSDSEEEDYDTGSETNSNPSLFECDFPHCNAKFVSRQALNGHIRVHGGSFMKPSEPRKRNKNSAPSASPPRGGSNTAVVKKRKPSPAPAPPPMNEDGTLPEFVCKVCGRIFHKIKSRSAHMKTHVKRPDEDEKTAKLGGKH